MVTCLSTLDDWQSLERIVAKALSCRALATGFVKGQQAGSVPGRSVMDLVAAFTTARQQEGKIGTEP